MNTDVSWGGVWGKEGDTKHPLKPVPGLDLPAGPADHGDGKPHKRLPVHPPWSLQPAWEAGADLWALPSHIPGWGGREPAHRPGYWLGLPPPHTHVLLSQQPLPGGCLLHLRHSSKDACEHPDTDPVHFLQRLPSPDLLLHFACKHGQLPPDGHGLWPLHGDMPAPALLHDDESASLCPDARELLSRCQPPLPAAHPPHGPAGLLCQQCHPLLLLWPCSPAPALLLQHPAQSTHNSASGGPDRPHPLPQHPRLLRPHCVCCAQGPICPGKTEGLFYL